MVFLSGSFAGTYGVSESGEMDLLMSCLAVSRLASSSFRHVPCSVLEVSTVALFEAIMNWRVITTEISSFLVPRDDV